jgi:beta-lactamase class D/beta-lactamase class D OXA-1
MNKVIAFFAALLSLNAMAYNIAIEHFAQSFKDYDGCFLIYSVNGRKMVSEYSPGNRCNQRLAPDSTFKIALSLMAFNQGIIDPKTIFKWDGIKGELPDWNQDQTPSSWLTYSVVWVSQHITRQLGLTRVKHYLDAFNYGNKDFSGDPGKGNGLAFAWLSSSLKISAYEQLTFLRELITKELPLSPGAVDNTIQNMYLGTLKNGYKYYGKTGSGRHGRNEREAHPSKLRDGWFVGFIEGDDKKYVFVSNLTDKSIPKEDNKAYGSQILKPITLELLNAYFDKKA